MIDRDKFEKIARERGVVPTAFRKNTKYGTVKFAEAFHPANPEHTVKGLVMSGWKTLWFLERDGVDYFGELWFTTGSARARFNTAVLDAEQFISDNLEVGRY